MHFSLDHVKLLTFTPYLLWWRRYVPSVIGRLRWLRPNWRGRFRLVHLSRLDDLWVSLQPSLQETARNSEGASWLRRQIRSSVVFQCQIQKTLFYEWIGIFSKAATMICLLLQKQTVHIQLHTTQDIGTAFKR